MASAPCGPACIHSTHSPFTQVAKLCDTPPGPAACWAVSTVGASVGSREPGGESLPPHLCQQKEESQGIPRYRVTPAVFTGGHMASGAQRAFMVGKNPQDSGLQPSSMGWGLRGAAQSNIYSPQDPRQAGSGVSSSRQAGNSTWCHPAQVLAPAWAGTTLLPGKRGWSKEPRPELHCTGLQVLGFLTARGAKSVLRAPR